MTTRAVDRANALLTLVVESSEPRTFTSLVDELGLAKSTTSRLLQALERSRLVHRDNAGAFSIYGRNPINGETPWSLVGLSGGAAGFASSFPWSRLQVLSPPGR